MLSDHLMAVRWSFWVIGAFSASFEELAPKMYELGIGRENGMVWGQSRVVRLVRRCGEPNGKLQSRRSPSCRSADSTRMVVC